MTRWIAAFAALFSALVVAIAAQAHEVRPTIGDLAVSGNEVTLALDLNVEAFVAGVNLDGLEDTNEVPEAEAYDVLRALSPDALGERFAPVAEQMAGAIAILRADGSPVALEFVDAEIGETGDVETLRDSRVSFRGVAEGNVAALSLRWPEGYGTLILRQVGVENGYTGYIDGGGASPLLVAAGGDAPGAWDTFVGYIPVGFDHILPKGLDHILFVLGLFFLSTRPGPLLWQITAFTLAHTVTLALGALGYVNLPGSVVEPIIAASIVYVAVENILSPQMSRWRPLVVFVFGLLHGLGFASVLGDFGLPQGQFIPALVGFNIGVELGQLTVIAIAYLLVGAWFGDKPWYRSRIAIPASAAIGLVGAYWFVERVFL